MTGLRRALVKAALALACSLGSGARAQSTAWQSNVEGWLIKAVENQRVCLAEALYHDGTRFRIGIVGPEKKLVFVFSKPGWNSLRRNTTYKIRFVFDGQKTWTGDATGAEWAGSPALIIDPVKEAFLTDFMNFYNIALFLENQSLGAFALRGSSAALIELRKCHDAGSVAGGPAGQGGGASAEVRPGVLACVGPLGRDATPRTIEAAFGKQNVLVQPVQKGQVAPPLLVFPDNPARRLEFYWRYPVSQRWLASIRLPEESRWKIAVPGTDATVGVGSTLEEVEHAHGKPFRFLAYGPEDGGLASPAAWLGGRLSQVEGGCALFLQFRPTVLAAASATGDGSDLMSNAESTRRLHPVVVRAELYWPTQHGEERGQRLQALLE